MPARNHIFLVGLPYVYRMSEHHPMDSTRPLSPPRFPSGVHFRPWVPVRRAWALVALLMGAVLGGCSGDAGDSDISGSESLRVAVSIPPLAWTAQALAPEGSHVFSLVEPGVSPHGAALSPSQARDLAGADLVVLVGWNLEPAIERALVTGRNAPRILRMSEILEEAGIDPPPLFSYDGGQAGSDSHDHGHEDPDDRATPGTHEHGRDHHQDQADTHEHGESAHGHHHHGPEDPHAWLDPGAMEALIRALAEALDASDEAVDRALAEVELVDSEYREALAGVRRRILVTHHDGFGWLARRYGLNVGGVIRPGGLVETRPSDVARIVEVVERNSLGGIFVEPQFGDRAAMRIRDLTGVEIFVLDPLGSGDWPATMRANLVQLKEGLNREPTPIRPGSAGMALSP